MSFPRLYHWSAAFGLDAHHARALRTDPAQLFHLVEGLPHSDQAYASTGGIDDAVRESSAELLEDLVRHSLLALDAIRFFQSGNIKPTFRFSTLGYNAGAIADQAVDQGDFGSVAFAFHAIGHGHILRHEDVGLNTSRCGVGSKRTGGVSCRGNRQ